MFAVVYQHQPLVPPHIQLLKHDDVGHDHDEVVEDNTDLVTLGCVVIFGKDELGVLA